MPIRIPESHEVGARAGRVVAMTAAFAGVAVLLVGCGARSAATNTSSGGDSHGGPGAKGGVQAAFKFSQCMRNHGAPNFPDPVVHQSANGQSISIRVGGPGIDPGSPAMVAAHKACKGILPGPNGNNGTNSDDTTAHKADMVSFADCMRSHGVSGFPDPNQQGQLSEEMLSAGNVNIHDLYVQKAAYACAPASHGAITAADVAAVIDHATGG